MNKFNSVWESFFYSRFIVPGLLFLASCIAYLNSFSNGFILDDYIVLLGQRGVANKSFYELFLYNQGDFFRPIGHILLWISYRIFGQDVFGYHLVNFILLFLIVFLFFIIIKKLTSDRALAFLSALFFAVHPINGFLVNYITASIISTFVLSMQGSFLFFLRFVELKKKKDYVLSFIFFLCACMAHEMTLMLPFFFLAYLFFMKRPHALKLSTFVIPYVLFLVAWFIFRSHESTFHRHIGNPAAALVNIEAYFSTWMDLVSWYLSKLFLSQDIVFLWSSQYGIRNVSLQLGALLFSLGLIGYSLFKWKDGWKPFLLTMFVAGLLPTLYSCFVYFPIVWPIIEPHWFYFSEIGFFVLLAFILKWIAQKNNILGGLLIVGAFIFFLNSSWDHNSKWKNQEIYSSYWLSLNQGNLTPYYGLGRSLMDKGDCVNASKIFRLGYNNLHMVGIELTADMGHCLDVLGDEQGASDYLKTALKMDPTYALTHHYIGLYYDRRGKFEKAQIAFRKSVELDPKFSSSYPYLKN